MTARSDILPHSEWVAFDAKEAAAALGISERTFHSEVKAGRLPQPTRIGKRCVWSKTKIREVVDGKAATDPMSMNGF